MKKHAILSVCFILLLALAWGAPDGVAYDTYQSQNQALDNCSYCHPGFDDGPWMNGGGPLHNLHEPLVAGNCNLCHYQVGVPVWLNWSDYGYKPGCTGCHLPEGLIAHHTNAGVLPDNYGMYCTFCHLPELTPDPDPEYTMPPYYGNEVPMLDPCDGSEELGSTLTISIDNDGDLLYDGNDPDCYGAICGDGIVGPLEECDDGNLSPGDGCDEFCKVEIPDCPGDFDSDGDVDGSDLAIVVADFGRTNCPMPITSSLKDEVTLLKREIERLEAEIVDKQKEIDALKVK